MSQLLKTPKIEKWMKPEDLDFRQHAISYLHTAQDQGLLPAPISNFGIFPTGEASVVFLVNQDTDPFVVKMVSHSGPVEETIFFKHWAKQGIKTPQIIGTHSPNPDLPVSFSILEYINAPTLEDTDLRTSDRIQKGISREIGLTLAKMHQAKGTGFGAIKDDSLIGNNSTITSELEETVFNHRADYLLRNNLINPQDIDIARKAVGILEDDLASGKTTPSLCHNDFRPYNILATKPMTVIDPNPRITHPAFCLSASLIKSLAESFEYGKQEATEVLSGYQQITTFPDQVLSAAIVLKSIQLLYVWSRKEKTEKINRTLELMKQEQEKIKNL